MSRSRPSRRTMQAGLPTNTPTVRQTRPARTGIIRARRAAAVAIGLSAVLALSACAQTQESAAVDGQDAATATALQAEGPLELVEAPNMENGLQAYLMKSIVESLGGEAEVTPYGDATVLATAMADSDSMLSMDFWRWQAPDVWDKFVEQDKTVVEIGTTDYKGEEGWYVPTYVIKGDPARNIAPMCPGLPNWEALNECASVFATSKTAPKGQYMEGAESWAPFYGDQERIDNLGLDYQMVFAGSEAALFAELTRAYERGEPWLGLMWRPNYLTQTLDLTRVEFPPYTEECWGTTFACQWPETTIYQIGSSELQEKHPTVWNILQKYEMPDERLAELQSYVIKDGLSIPDAAQKWVDENKDIWQGWVA